MSKIFCYSTLIALAGFSLGFTKSVVANEAFFVADSSAAVTPTAEANDATRKLLAEGFNRPSVDAEQWAVFSTDVPQAAKDRYFSSMEAVTSSYGRYMNWNFLAFNKDGSDTVNAPVIQRWSELHPDYAAENTVTTAKLINETGCLNGSSTGAVGTSDYELHSICYQMTLDNLIPDTTINPYFESNDILVASLFQHEYFHHYQRAHMLDVGLGEVPRWWIEGAALANEYWWLRSNWMNIEFLKDHPGNAFNTVEEEIDGHILNVSNRSFWRYSQRIQKRPPYFDSFGNEEEGQPDCFGWLLDENTDMDNGPICDRRIATQAPLYFMAHKSSWQAVLRDIPSDYYEYGFWGAVEKHTGLNEQQFYDEFNATMRSVDWSTIDSEFAPDGWNIPDEAIESAVDFLNIDQFTIADFDDDGDGVLDSADAFPLDASETLDTDSDGTGNNADTDDDGDGVADGVDAFPLDASETVDSDNDGVGDRSDIFPDDATESVDSDSDSVGDNADNCPLVSNADSDAFGDACDYASGGLSPTTYGVDEYWGQIVDFEQDVLFSSDVSQEVRDGFTSTLELVIDFYGNYGPIEWWIVGADQSASDQLALEFANRRQVRNQLDVINGVGDFETTLERAKSFLGSYAGKTQAGLNGNRGHGYHLLAAGDSLLKGGLTRPISYVVENPNLSIVSVAHEYTHVVQAALLFNKESYCEPDNCYRVGWGPVFFSEGAATYYGYYLPRKLRSEGKNVIWDEIDNSSLRNRMQGRMDLIQRALVNCPNFDLEDINYSTRDTCSPYDFGAWGTAYLLNKIDDQDAMWKSLWPNIDELGWDGAFEATFGITVEQFNQEFLVFLELPLEKQLEIIPDFGSTDKDADGLIDSAEAELGTDPLLADTDDDGVDDNLDAFPLNSSESADSDLDGVGDNADAFPNDSSETVDTDNDGIGNNADTDDDGDGLSDEIEISIGYDPLNANDATGSSREIFWRNVESGQNILWSMETQYRVKRNQLNTVSDVDWKVAGMADFTGDGLDEIFFRHMGNGSNRLWFIEVGQRTESLAVPGAPTDWQIVAMGDGDGDGDADLMWRNPVTGANRYWEMDGERRVRSAGVRGVALDWQVAGSDDFDGDGLNDLLWRNSNGANIVWLMDGESIKERAAINGAGVEWTVAGTGDFDGDGMADLLWHNPERGHNTVWLLNGTERKARGSIPRVSSGWQPVGVIDMDADGMADILWRNTSGANRLWLMKAMSRAASLKVQGVGDPLWEVVAVGDVAD